jgi:vacuolar protein sorting-associated protein 45
VVTFERAVDSLFSALLALKKKPLIRYAKGSELASRAAKKLSERMDEERALFDFRRPDVPPVLLILDRRDDPLTPLLMQWTYQAMVHELVGIKYNSVDLSGRPNVAPENQEVVLSAMHDAFFASNMFTNFGDLGMNLQELMNQYQAQTRQTKKLDTIEDMKRVLENFPEIKAMAGSVSKHVALSNELGEMLDKHMLLEVSTLEQELACAPENMAQHFDMVVEMCAEKSLTEQQRLRLLLLFALRYESEAGRNVKQLKKVLADQGVSTKLLKSVSKMYEYGGTDVRSEPLFGKDVFNLAKNIIQRQVPFAANTLCCQHARAH